MKRYLPFFIIAIVFLLVLGSIAMLTRAPKDGSSPQGVSSSQPIAPAGGATSAAPAGASTAPSGPVLLGAIPPHVQGPQNAPVTLEEFGDFQCPPCGIVHKALKDLEKEYGTRYKLVFREFPLPTAHKHAVEAAQAAEAADMQGRFWPMHDLLYDNQQAWTPLPDARPAFVAYARSLGMDTDRFTRDMDSTMAASRVALDQARGTSLGVKGTPTIFIDGKEMNPNDMTYLGIRAALDLAIQKKG
jgi:protein-disulfide isomerase